MATGPIPLKPRSPIASGPTPRRAGVALVSADYRDAYLDRHLGSLLLARVLAEEDPGDALFRYRTVPDGGVRTVRFRLDGLADPAAEGRGGSVARAEGSAIASTAWRDRSPGRTVQPSGCRYTPDWKRILTGDSIGCGTIRDCGSATVRPSNPRSVRVPTHCRSRQAPIDRTSVGPRIPAAWKK